MAWYYSVNGKAEGPVTQEFLLESLRAGRLTLVDLAFKEGAQAWATLGEFAEFRDAYNSNPLPAPKTPGSAKPTANASHAPGAKHAAWEYVPSWVVLKQKDKSFEQSGPYTEEQILEMIGSGEVAYSQYVWRPGYKRWVRIGNLPEFDRRKRDREGDAVNQIIPLPNVDSNFPVLTREELLGAIERLHPKPVASTESQPAEAKGADLAEPAKDRFSSMEATRVTSMFSKPLESKPKSYDEMERTRVEVFKTQEPEREQAPVEKPTKKTEKIAQAEVTNVTPGFFTKKNVIRASIAVFSSVLLVAGVLNFYSKKSSSLDSASNEDEVQTSESKPEPPAQEPKVKSQEPPAQKAQAVAPPAAAPVASTQATPAPIEKAVAAPQPSKPATVVEITPLRMTTKPVLAFQSDIGVGDAIKVTLEAKTGDILQFPSFYAEYEVRRASGEVGTLDLSALKVPQGTYRVRAYAGAALDEAVIFVGVRNAEFERAREKNLKEIATQQQAEKKAMYYGAQRLETLARTLTDSYRKLRREPKQWSKFSSNWKQQAKDAARPVVSIAYKAKPNTLAFRTELREFQEATEKLGAFAKQLDSAVSQKREIAGSPGDELVKEFGRLKAQASRLSGR
ncbi:MAG TPA: GYF domain-containing protein [Bdellovibrionales bacterium]|nr:GYF domain-containing protein [Bdellovibrionales bacterium]